MKGDKHPDRLSKASTMAIAAGISYGKWMAMHEGEIKSPESEKKRYGNKFICHFCGKEFIRYDKRKRKYCGDECRIMASEARDAERYHQRIAKQNEAQVD